MKVPEIIRQSWHMTIEHKYLVSLGTFASVFTLLLGFYRVRYFLPEPIFTFTDIFRFIESHTDKPYYYFILYLVLFGLLYLSYLVINVLVEGGLIASIAKIKVQNVNLSFSRGLSLGVHSFLPLMEYRVITSFFNIVHIILYIFLFRYYLLVFTHDAERVSDIITPLYPIFAIVLVFVGIISLFLTYGEYNLVINRKGVIRSIRKSITLVVFHLGETVLISVLVLLIFIRAVINLLLIFLIPTLIAFLIGKFALILPVNVLIGIGILITLVLFYLTARISGTLYAFTTAVWTLTFLELEERREYAILPGQSDSFKNDDDKD